MITDRQLKFRLAVLAVSGAVLLVIAFSIPGQQVPLAMLGGGTTGVGTSLLGMQLFSERRLREYRRKHHLN